MGSCGVPVNVKVTLSLRADQCKFISADRKLINGLQIRTDSPFILIADGGNSPFAQSILGEKQNLRGVRVGFRLQQCSRQNNEQIW